MRVLIAHAPPLLVEELLRRDHDLVVAHEPHGRPCQFTTRHTARFAPIPRLPKLDPRSILAMRRMITTCQPDLIHAFSPRSLAAATLGTLGMRSRPDIVSFRGISSIPSRIDLGNYVTFLSPRVDAHTCESHAVADGLSAAGVPSRACHVIYNCVDPQSLVVHDRGELRARFGIPEHAFVVGSIATIRPVKGIDILLRAVLECGDIPELMVMLVGPLKDRRVRRIAADARWGNRLCMTGHLPHAGGMAVAFDMFAMPSRSEGLCRAMLEAMSLGVCPVVSDAGGMKEVVRHGHEGLVFPRENVTALATTIRHLATHRHLLRQYGEAARRRVATMCSPAAMAARIERCYLSLGGQTLALPSPSEPVRRAA